MAQSIKSAPTAPRRTIAFVMFGYEENDGVCEGSEYYAKNPPTQLPLGNTVYMVDMDMVGTYDSEKSVTAYGSFIGTPARTVLDARLPAYPNLTVVKNRAADKDASDFQAFCNNGVPYLYFETWDDTCYHNACDDPSRIDDPNMISIAKMAAEVTTELANSEQNLKSTRTSPATRCTAN